MTSRAFTGFFSILFLLSSCKEAPTVRFARAKAVAVESTVSSVNSGTVRAEQNTELAFGTVGRVSSIRVKLGDTVVARTVLSELENTDLKIATETLKRELDRRTGSAQSRASSQNELDLLRRQFEQAAATLEKSLIRAPFDGVIAELNLEVGQLSQITAIIPKAPIRLVDLKPRYVRAEFDEADFSRLKVGLPVRITVLAVRRDPFRGSIRKVVPYVSTIREQDRTNEVELTVESEGLILPAGASADVEAVVDHREKALAVPSRAVLGSSSNRYIYVLDDYTVRKRPIQVGIFNYDRTEVVGGIEPNDAVIIPTDALELAEEIEVRGVEEAWP